MTRLDPTSGEITTYDDQGWGGFGVLGDNVLWSIVGGDVVRTDLLANGTTGPNEIALLVSFLRPELRYRLVDRDTYSSTRMPRRFHGSRVVRLRCVANGL